MVRRDQERPEAATQPDDDEAVGDFGDDEQADRGGDSDPGVSSGG